VGRDDKCVPGFGAELEMLGVAAQERRTRSEDRTHVDLRGVCQLGWWRKLARISPLTAGAVHRDPLDF
jgi:hypothetical protein